MVVEKNTLRSKLAKMSSNICMSEAIVPVASIHFAKGRSIHTRQGHGALLRFELHLPQCAIHPLIQALALASLVALGTPATAVESNPTEATSTATAESNPTDMKLTLAILSFLGGALVATIGAISMLAATQRRIQMDNVVEERAKWRDKIRCLTSEVHEAIMEKDPVKRRTSILQLKVKFCIVLNPYDCKDKKILESMDDIYKCDCGDGCKCAKTRKEKSDKFSKRISRLLKHDWERAKEEVKHPIFQWWIPERGERKSNCSQKTLQGGSCLARLSRCLRGRFCRKNARFRCCKVVWTLIWLAVVPVALFLIYRYFLCLASVFV